MENAAHLVLSHCGGGAWKSVSAQNSKVARSDRLDSKETQSLSSSLILMLLHQNIGCRRGPLTWKQQRASQALVGTSKTDGEDPWILSLLSLGMACPTLALSQISSSMCASSFEWLEEGT